MSTDTTPYFIASNLALDFINTRFGVGDEQQECLIDDDSVVDWLQQAGVLEADFAQAPAPGLVRLARELRDNLRDLLDAARRGEAAEASVVNQILERGNPLESLVWQAQQKAFVRQQHRRDDHAESLLQPVAQAAVQLLTEENLQLVKECEAPDCVLLFHDQTKSHRRRWCSMATCGNRMKAASHRARMNAG
ncbi:ABATE domain-containing protein [Saccharospirillum sp. HFRX-1]|uniref:CGNR zinc finger domain-containing protein n=1 Tax=unclassified Saccharospirillum TaxID=2633430 RepID=UPI0037215FC9